MEKIIILKLCHPERSGIIRCEWFHAVEGSQGSEVTTNVERHPSRGRNVFQRLSQRAGTRGPSTSHELRSG